MPWTLYSGQTERRVKFLVLNTDYPDFLRWLYGQHSGLEGQSYDEQYRSPSKLKTMRLLAIVTKSISYISDFYSRHPLLASQPYEDQYAALADDKFGGSEIWSTGLLEFGYESARVFANIPQIQKRWAQEEGIHYDESTWMENITEKQIEKYQPDILFISNHATFSAEFVKKIRNEIPSIRLVIGWCGSPYQDPAIFREYDLILSNIPELVEGFVANGHCCYHLNHAFDPRVLDKIDTNKLPSVNFSFVGSIIKAAGFHTQREALLLELVRATDLEIWTTVENPTQKQRIKMIVAQLSYDTVQAAMRARLPKERLTKVPWFGKLSNLKQRPSFRRYVDRRIARRAHPPLFGIPMFQKLRDSKVTLNTHIDVSQNSASNMRLFEATGVGTCLLTDWKENLKDLYEPDVEVVTYRDSKECIEKARYLLQNEKERQAIAEAGQRRALQDHTIYNRAEQLNDIIKEHLRRI